MEANQITVRLEDEEYVRSVWASVDRCGAPWRPVRIFHSPEPVMDFQAWIEAAEFTRARLEQVRQLKFDIAHVTKFRNGVGAYCHQHPYTTQTLEVEIPNLESWKRILARLEAALATLTRGIRPEALEGATR